MSSYTITPESDPILRLLQQRARTVDVSVGTLVAILESSIFPSGDIAFDDDNLAGSEFTATQPGKTDNATTTQVPASIDSMQTTTSIVKNESATNTLKDIDIEATRKSIHMAIKNHTEEVA